MKLISKEDEQKETLTAARSSEHITPGSLLCPRFCLPQLTLSFPAASGSEVYMNSCFYGNGTSFVESLFEDFGEQILRAAPQTPLHQPCFVVF